jgi:hypothetical protein
MDKYAHQLLCEHFPQARIFACASPLTEYFAQKSREDQCKKLYVHFRKNTMEVFAFDRSKLLIINTFSSLQPSDQVYYLLYIWKQLGFEQERDELHLTGKFLAKEALMQELQKYIKQVFIMNPATNLDFQAITSCE